MDTNPGEMDKSHQNTKCQRMANYKRYRRRPKGFGGAHEGLRRWPYPEAPSKGVAHLVRHPGNEADPTEANQGREEATRGVEVGASPKTAGGCRQQDTKQTETSGPVQKGWSGERSSRLNKQAVSALAFELALRELSLNSVLSS